MAKNIRKMREATLDREKLYNDLWTIGVKKTSKKYHMSITKLVGVCREANIPTPSNQYWIMQRTGGNPEKDPLPASESNYFEVKRKKSDTELGAQSTKQADALGNIAYYMNTTPRQIGLENSVEDLREARHVMLPKRDAQMERFEIELNVLPYLDKKVSPEDFSETAGKYRISEADAALACVIECAIRVAESKRVLKHNVVTLNEFAATHGKNPVVVRQKCNRGYVRGAVNYGMEWMVPVDTEYKDVRRLDDKGDFKMEPGKTKEEKIEYFLRKTPRQVGFENEEEQLQKDMSLLIPANMQGKLTLEEALVKLDTANPYNEIKSGIEELEAVSACIAAAIYVARAKKIIFHNMVSTSECGKMIGKKPDIIRQKCLRGTMEGATKIGIMWYIPVDSLYVQKNRKKDYSG